MQRPLSARRRSFRSGGPGSPGKRPCGAQRRVLFCGPFPGKGARVTKGSGDGVAPGRNRLLLALLAAGLLLRLLIAWSPFSYLAHRGPLLDDAFYSFSIARNLATGHGPTADGIHATSGFQPLYTFLLVPFYHLFPHSPILPIHLALTLLALCGALTGWFLYRFVSGASGRRAGLFSLALWTFSPYFLFQGENGLETGLFGMSLAATLAFYLNAARKSPTAGRLCVLGFMLGITILARVDGILLAVALALDLLLLRRPLKEKITGVALSAAVALATLSPYLLFLWVRFGVVIPESGSAVRFLSLCYGTLFVLGPRSAFFFSPDQVPAIYYVGSLRKAVQILLGEPLLFPSSLLLYPASAARMFNPRTLLLVLGGGILLAANLFPLRSRSGAGDAPPSGLLRVGVICAAFWIPAYAFGVLGQWWFNRYLFPLFLLMAAASGPLVDLIGASFPLFRRMGPTRFALFALGLHLACFLTQVPEQFLRNKPYQNVSEYMAAARTLDLALPPGSLGGAFQSGTLGYFARHRVINLDGVVNRDATRALRDKRMADYIREEGIEAIIDWPRWLDALLIRRSPQGAGRSLGPAQPAGRFLLIRVEPPHNRVAALPPYR
jgi:Dolichyl-phosphate-mannose-protein mannosyltransferase